MNADEEEFMRKVDARAGKLRGEQVGFYHSLNIYDNVEMLYVEGIPLREYVAKHYGYKAKAGAKRLEEIRILRCYAAMIAARQNHPITLMKPVLRDQRVEMDIRGIPVSVIEVDKSSAARKKDIAYRKKCRELGALRSEEGTIHLSQLLRKC